MVVSACLEMEWFRFKMETKSRNRLFGFVVLNNNTRYRVLFHYYLRDKSFLHCTAIKNVTTTVKLLGLYPKY